MAWSPWMHKAYAAYDLAEKRRKARVIAVELSETTADSSEVTADASNVTADAGAGAGLNDFRNGMPVGTYTRTGPASGRTLAGLVLPFAADAPQRTDAGLALEPARTNDLLRSTDFANAAGWSALTGMGVPVLQSATGSPIDNGPIHRCTMTATPGTGGLTQPVGNRPALVQGATYAVPFLLKRVNNDWQKIDYSDNAAASCSIWVNLATGALGAATVTGNPAIWSLPTASVIALSGGWYLVWLFSTRVAANMAAGTASTYTYPVSTDGSVTRVANAAFDIADSERQTGAFATSPIVTAGAAVTRGLPVFTEPVPLGRTKALLTFADASTLLVTGLTPGGTFDVTTAVLGANKGRFGVSELVTRQWQA